MAETLTKAGPEAGRAAQYAILLPQVEALIAGEPDLIANLANICAALHETFHHLWTGFYLVKNNELVLGPFQGPLACTRIQYAKGVCGTAWKEKQTILVPDVDAFPGHIACSTLSKSEIVVPVLFNREVVMVLDIDSENLNDFSETDRESLTALASLISTHPSARDWFG